MTTVSQVPELLNHAENKHGASAGSEMGDRQYVLGKEFRLRSEIYEVSTSCAWLMSLPLHTQVPGRSDFLVTLRRRDW
jgi:hypothetical protein